MLFARLDEGGPNWSSSIWRSSPRWRFRTLGLGLYLWYHTILSNHEHFLTSNQRCESTMLIVLLCGHWPHFTFESTSAVRIAWRASPFCKRTAWQLSAISPIPFFRNLQYPPAYSIQETWFFVKGCKCYYLFSSPCLHSPPITNTPGVLHGYNIWRWSPFCLSCLYSTWHLQMIHNLFSIRMPTIGDAKWYVDDSACWLNWFIHLVWTDYALTSGIASGIVECWSLSMPCGTHAFTKITTVAWEEIRLLTSHHWT